MQVTLVLNLDLLVRLVLAAVAVALGISFYHWTNVATNALARQIKSLRRKHRERRRGL